MYIIIKTNENLSATKYGYKNIENYVSLVHPRVYIYNDMYNIMYV